MPPLPSGTPWEKRKSPTGDQRKKCHHRVATAPIKRSSPRTLPLQGLIRASCPAHLEPEEVSPCWPAPVYSNISPNFSRSYPCFVNHFFIKISSNYSSVFCWDHDFSKWSHKILILKLKYILGVLCDNPEGWDRVGGGRFKREGTCVHLWLIHADVWQKPTL